MMKVKKEMKKMKTLSKRSKNSDAMYHTCRWCKNYNNSLHTCSVLPRKLNIIDSNDPYDYLDEPIVEIGDAENFSCSEWQ